MRRSRYRDHSYKVTLKNPAWLSQLEPSAPLNGYLMEHGEFNAELAKDERINEDLKEPLKLLTCKSSTKRSRSDSLSYSGEVQNSDEMRFSAVEFFGGFFIGRGNREARGV